MKVHCPVCETYLNILPLEIFQDPWFGHTYKYYVCPNCDVGFWEPRKIIPEFYEREYLYEYEDRHKGKLKRLKYYHEEFFPRCPVDLKGLKILDVGCGNGLFLKEVQSKGAEVWGIDLDNKSVKFAQQKLDLKNIYALSLDNFVEFASQRFLSFDIICFFEVLEHQENPKDFLSKIYGLLKEDGYIIGTVPNRNSFLTKRAPESYVDYPPNHFFRFSAGSIKNLLQEVNFKNIEITSLILPLGKCLKELDEYICRVYFKNISALFFNLIFGSQDREVRRKAKGPRKRIYKTLRFLKAISLRPVLLPIVLIFRSRMDYPTLLFMGKK